MINNITIVGRITDSIELRKTKTNKSVTKFSIAVDRDRKDEMGNKITDFVRIVAWESKADFLANYAGKGTLVGITGRVETNKYLNQQGVNVTEVYIRCNTVEILKQPQQATTSQAVTKITKDDFNDFPEEPWYDSPEQ